MATLINLEKLSSHDLPSLLSVDVNTHILKWCAVVVPDATAAFFSAKHDREADFFFLMNRCVCVN